MSLNDNGTKTGIDKKKGDDKKGEVKIPLNVGEQGLVISSFDEMWRFSQMVCRSGLAPKGLNKPESVMIAIQVGMEHGISPMISLQNSAVINGKHSYYGDLPLALVRRSGIFDESVFKEEQIGEGDDMIAYCTLRRKPEGKERTFTFSMKEAKQAKLVKNDTYQKFPKRMLLFRARTYGLRDLFGDVLNGVPIYEELVGTDEPLEDSAPPRSLNDLIKGQDTSHIDAEFELKETE